MFPSKKGIDYLPTVNQGLGKPQFFYTIIEIKDRYNNIKILKNISHIIHVYIYLHLVILYRSVNGWFLMVFHGSVNTPSSHGWYGYIMVYITAMVSHPLQTSPDIQSSNPSNPSSSSVLLNSFFRCRIGTTFFLDLGEIAKKHGDPWRMLLRSVDQAGKLWNHGLPGIRK